MKRPYIPFYFGDWRANSKVQALSFHLRGVWLEVIGLLHDSDEYGVLRVPAKELAFAARCKIGDIAELHRRGVLKGCDAGLMCDPLEYVAIHARRAADPVVVVPAQDGPIWYSSRMVVDEHVRKRRGHSAGAGYTPLSGTKHRQTILNKTGGKCYHCRCVLDGYWEIDHYVPASKGGSNHIDNLVPSCRPCNAEKGDSLPHQSLKPASNGDSPKLHPPANATATAFAKKKLSIPTVPIGVTKSSSTNNHKGNGRAK